MAFTLSRITVLQILLNQFLLPNSSLIAMVIRPYIALHRIRAAKNFTLPLTALTDAIVTFK